jgi:SAM-dependent methyltransferase
MTETYSFTRYLAAKKSVDDRALNRHVLDGLARELGQSASDQPLRVLEIGAGIGTMIERTLERGLLASAHYTALDALPENIDYALERLPRWARQSGYQVSKLDESTIELEKAERSTHVHFEALDLFDFARSEPGKTWDLLIAHAFLDLMDIPATLPVIFDLLGDGGLFYFSVNFDGATLFEPMIDVDLDERVQALYHRTMDERITAGVPSGDSRAGRHLFRHIQGAGGHILAAGASDWVVFPGVDGYPGDEAYFLHFIVDTIHQALEGHPELDDSGFAAWVAERHAQIDRGELVYIAHQLDFLGRVGARETCEG